MSLSELGTIVLVFAIGLWFGIALGRAIQDHRNTH